METVQVRGESSFGFENAFGPLVASGFGVDVVAMNTNYSITDRRV